LVDPITAEGFSEILTVTNDKEVELALEKFADLPKKIGQNGQAPSNKKASKNNDPPKEKSESGCYNPYAALGDE